MTSSGTSVAAPQRLLDLCCPHSFLFVGLLRQPEGLDDVIVGVAVAIHQRGQPIADLCALRSGGREPRWSSAVVARGFGSAATIASSDAPTAPRQRRRGAAAGRRARRTERGEKIDEARAGKRSVMTSCPTREATRRRTHLV